MQSEFFERDSSGIITSFVLFCFFIPLYWVTVVAHGIFDLCCNMRVLLVGANGIFSCGMQTLNCGMWDI